MTKTKLVVLFALISGLSGQLPIPSWAQWLSDDEKSWQVFTINSGCDYEELNTPYLPTFKKQVVDKYIKEGWEITEENIDASIEKWWAEETKDYPLQHIEDGYRMLRIVDASDVSEYHDEKVVVWEYYLKLRNVSLQKLKVDIQYRLTGEDGLGFKAIDEMWFYIESGETGTYSSTAYFPIKRLEEIESRSWSISYDY